MYFADCRMSRQVGQRHSLKRGTPVGNGLVKTYSAKDGDAQIVDHLPQQFWPEQW